MRPVNLLPASRRVHEGGSRPGSAYVVLGVLGALLVAVVMYVLTANGLTEKKDQLAELRAETEAAQQRAAALGSFGDFAQIKQQREAAVTDLAQARLDWERLVRELAHVLPEDVYVSNLEANAAGPAQTGNGAPTDTGPSLKLTGCAPSNPDIATLMVRLRKLHRSNDVTLTNSDRSDGKAGECGRGYAFGVNVSFDQAPKAPTTENVPAHLGGGA